jgi:predicted membrane-bound mannosyltransferase
MYDAEGTCTVTVEETVQTVENQQPTVVIVPTTMENRLESELDGYRAETYGLRTTGNGAVFFVRTDG